MLLFYNIFAAASHSFSLSLSAFFFETFKHPSFVPPTPRNLPSPTKRKHPPSAVYVGRSASIMATSITADIRTQIMMKIIFCGQKSREGHV